MKVTCACGALLDDEAVDFCAQCGAPARRPEQLSPQSRWVIGLNVFLNGVAGLFFSWILAVILYSLRSDDFGAAFVFLAIAGAGAVYFWRTVYLVASGKRRAKATAAMAVTFTLLALAGYSSISSFQRMRRRAQDRETQRNVGTLRECLRVYAEDHRGKFPESLSELTPQERYLKSLLPVKLSDHADSTAVLPGTVPDDAGGWLYDKTQGKIWVNCTHTDWKGNLWSAY